MRFAIVSLCVLLAAGVAGTAAPLFNDPQILIDTGGDSLPISTSIGIAQPCSPGPCTFDFFNDTGGILTNFTFETTINTGLSAAAINSFTCADPSGFFLNCNIHYVSSSGDLKYLFNGVNPPDGDENLEPELNEHEGIPPLGHFIIRFTGWQEDLKVGDEQVYAGVPATTNNFETTAAPEPGAALAVGTGLLLLATMLRRRTVRAR